MQSKVTLDQELQDLTFEEWQDAIDYHKTRVVYLKDTLELGSYRIQPDVALLSTIKYHQDILVLLNNKYPEYLI